MFAEFRALSGCYLLYWLFMQEYETGSDSQKFPVGTKVQAVYSEDGEWYV